MLQPSFSLIVLLSAVALAQQPFFINDDVSLPYYPYVVHLPSNGTAPKDAPAVLMLHGVGSRGPPDEIDELATWNGIGKRLKEYHDGNQTNSSIFAANDFVSIIPIAPMEDLTEWHIDALPPILEKVYNDYGYDRSRLYLMGYSMGARDAWKLLLQNPGIFAAAAICAGEPDADTDLTGLLNVPIRHYQGQQDYVSLQADAEATQQKIQALGGNLTELIIVSGVDHNNMANAPFDISMFSWLAQQSLNTTNATTSVAPSLVSGASSLAATSTDVGAPASISAALRAKADSSSASSRYANMPLLPLWHLLTQIASIL